MARLVTKTLVSRAAVADHLEEVAIRGVRKDLMSPNSLHTWFGLDTPGVMAFSAVFEDLTETPSVEHPKRSSVYDFIVERNEDVKRMYFLNMAECIRSGVLDDADR